MTEQSDVLVDGPILLFDGECRLCNGSVLFFLRHERDAVARFTSLQAPAGRRLLQEHQLDADGLETMVLLENGRAYQRSTAILRAARLLRAPWCWLAVLLWIPRPMRDLGYGVLAGLRYRILGRQEGCRLADAGLGSRFIDDRSAIDETISNGSNG